MPGLDLLLGAVADGDQDDHGGDADRHAEDRQAGAQLVRGDPGQRDAQRLAAASRGVLVGSGLLVGEHPSVAEPDDAPRAGGDIAFVGDQHDGAARRR